MNNHTHVVPCVDKDLVDNWSMEEVIKRWHQMYQGTLLSQKYQRGDKLSKGECISLDETVSTSPVKRIKKINAQADFTRLHPWRSPFGPAEAVLIYSQ
jgi:hypothetical protein